MFQLKTNASRSYFGGCEALPRKESLLLVFGNHDYQVMCFFPQGKIDVGEGNHN